MLCYQLYNIRYEIIVLTVSAKRMGVDILVYTNVLSKVYRNYMETKISPAKMCSGI